MHIYDVEKKAGLANSLCNSRGLGVSKVTSQIKTTSLSAFNKMIASLKSISQEFNSVEELIGDDQPDLALIVSVLASVGWNLNDDIFTSAELWKARGTAIHKPMNHMHDGNIILGHIVKSFAIDKTGNEIILGNEDNIPSDFDVQVAGVLYKFLPERADIIDEILTKANSGEMFVSMECWFPDFAYGFLDPDTGKTKIIERNESTAFLTKHLKIFNGTGEFEGNKVGRVLKDFVFGGQGFVTEPANPESVINVAAERVAASRSFESASLDDISKGGVDRMNDKEIQAIQDELKATKTDLEEVKANKDELTKKVEAMEAEDFETRIDALKQKVDELTASVTEANENIEATKKEKVELQKKLDEAVNEADKAKSELEAINKSVKANERFEKLSKIKDIEDKEAALAELAEMTDETFDVVMKYAGKAKEGSEAQTDDNSDKGDSDTAQATLNDAEPEKDADLQPGNDNPEDKDENTALALAHTLTGCKHMENEGGE